MPDLNQLYSTYVENPTSYNLDDLLTAIRKVAMSVFHDDDQAQDFLVEVWPLLPELKIRDNFNGWLRTRLYWRDLNNHTANQSCREEQPPVMFDDDGEQMTDEEVLALLDYQHKLRQPKAIEVDLSTIDDPIVRYIAERLLQGYTQTEIAAEMGINRQTLYQRLYRYRSKSQRER
jgi:DNA-directed RNA polymerase specialized sigma24 family protein